MYFILLLSQSFIHLYFFLSCQVFFSFSPIGKTPIFCELTIFLYFVSPLLKTVSLNLFPSFLFKFFCLYECQFHLYPCFSTSSFLHFSAIPLSHILMLFFFFPFSISPSFFYFLFFSFSFSLVIIFISFIQSSFLFTFYSIILQFKFFFFYL